MTAAAPTAREYLEEIESYFWPSGFSENPGTDNPDRWVHGSWYEGGFIDGIPTAACTVGGMIVASKMLGVLTDPLSQNTTWEQHAHWLLKTSPAFGQAMLFLIDAIDDTGYEHPTFGRVNAKHLTQKRDYFAIVNYITHWNDWEGECQNMDEDHDCDIHACDPELRSSEEVHLVVQSAIKKAVKAEEHA